MEKPGIPGIAWISPIKSNNLMNIDPSLPGGIFFACQHYLSSAGLSFYPPAARMLTTVYSFVFLRPEDEG